MNKSELFMINDKAWDQDLVNVPFKIVTDPFVYLGICVTKQLNYLFKEESPSLAEIVQAYIV